MPSVVVIVFRQPGANIIQTVERIHAQLPFLEAVLPQGIDITIVLDRTTTIRASVHDVEMTLLDLHHAWWWWSFSFFCAARAPR